MTGWLDSGGGDGWDLLTPEQQNDLIEAEEARDKRWEKVWASIGPVPISGSDIETGFYKTLEKLVEIRIRVPYGVTVYTSTHRASKEQLEEFRGDLLSLILDRMVANIDDMLNRSANA